MLIALALRNLWRRPSRTFLSVLSVAIVAALLIFMLSFQLGVYATMKENTLRIFDGFAQFQPSGYADDPSLNRAIKHPLDVVLDAENVWGVGAAAPRINGFAILANGERSYGAAIVGVDPEREARISSIAATIEDGRYLKPSDEATAVLGDVLARNLQIGVGKRLTLLGAARDGSVAADVLRVAGIYHSGVPELDRSILEMPFRRAKTTFAMGDRASTIAIGGPSLASINATLPALNAVAVRNGLIVMDWGELEPAMRDAITLKYATSLLFYLTLVVVVSFIILNTLLMSVLERTREFGMLLALGMRASAIGRMIWIELLALSLIGCVIGAAIGVGATAWFETTGIEFAGLGKLLAQFGLPPRLYPSLTLFSALAGPAALLFSVTVGGIVPYLRVMHLAPALAARTP